MKQIKNDFAEFMDKSKFESIHKEAFNNTYNLISEFSKKSNEIYRHLESKLDEESSNYYIHEVLCAPPGHYKTTSLEYYIKKEIHQTQTKKNPYLLVFNNMDTMNTFFENVHEFALYHDKKNAIVAIHEQNLNQFKTVLEQYQVICISQQRLRDLALGFGDVYSFLFYQQEPLYWGKKPPKLNKTLVHRTVIIDEMPEFFNKSTFDIGKENNAVDWYDVFSNNTNEENLNANDKNKGRLFISRLINNELYSIGRTTKKLIRTIEGTSEEQDFINILESLNKNESDCESINRYKWFYKLLTEDKTGAINRTAKKTNILCSEFIDYCPLGNILILDGTSNLTHSIYDFAGFKIRPIHNYHKYEERLRFFWCKINTSSSKRTDLKSDVKEQIANQIIEMRSKGINILPIPSKGDVKFYLKSGAITIDQEKQFFTDRQSEKDSLAINLHNVTGKNDLSTYNDIALLNLPILQPDEYRLQAIAIYGVDVDLRLVKELDDSEERKLHKDKWFVDDRLQKLFEEQQKAELSQIIHRSAIRKIDSNEKVTIHLFHNKKQVNDLLKEIFQVPNSNFISVNLQKENNLKAKCEQWASQIIITLKNDPNNEYTAYKVGGSKFKKWLENYWKDNEVMMRQIFKEHKITISIKGKGNYKYFKHVDNGILGDISDEELEDLFS